MLAHEISQRHVSKGQDVSQLIIFTMSPGTLSKSGFPPFHRKCAAIENTVSTSVIQRHCPDFCFSPTLLLRYWFKMSAQWKCQRTPYYRNRLDPPPQGACVVCGPHLENLCIGMSQERRLRTQ